MKKSIDVLLVDDHAVVRTGYRLLLSQSEGVNRVIEAETGEQACQKYLEINPSVVVMDLSLPGIGGLASIRRIISRDPNARILVFSIHNQLVYVTRALEAGAKGYITKSCAPEMLVDAVHSIVQNKLFLEPEIVQRLAADRFTSKHTSDLDVLSGREFEVFCLMAKGHTTQEAADKLHLSIKTVANYNTLVKSKLSAKTSADLTRIAYQSGLFNDQPG